MEKHKQRKNQLCSHISIYAVCQTPLCHHLVAASSQKVFAFHDKHTSAQKDRNLNTQEACTCLPHSKQWEITREMPCAFSSCFVNLFWFKWRIHQDWDKRQHTCCFINLCPTPFDMEEQLFAWIHLKPGIMMEVLSNFLDVPGVTVTHLLAVKTDKQPQLDACCCHLQQLSATLDCCNKRGLHTSTGVRDLMTAEALTCRLGVRVRFVDPLRRFLQPLVQNVLTHRHSLGQILLIPEALVQQLFFVTSLQKVQNFDGTLLEFSFVWNGSVCLSAQQVRNICPISHICASDIAVMLQRSKWKQRRTLLQMNSGWLEKLPCRLCVNLAHKLNPGAGDLESCCPDEELREHLTPLQLNWLSHWCWNIMHHVCQMVSQKTPFYLFSCLAQSFTKTWMKAKTARRWTKNQSWVMTSAQPAL